jgi:hypothetical protein
MEPNRVIAVLTEIGKAVRLFRYYAPSHPSVQRAIADLAVVLPGLANLGTVELRITAQGFESGNSRLAPQNDQLREFAQLLYGLGNRQLVIEPGATADEVAALVHALVGAAGAAGRKLGVVPRLPPLPHIRLAQAAIPSARSTPDRAEETPAFAHRSTGVFRPDALPADIEAHRILEQLATTPGEFLLGSVARLDVLAGQLAGDREFGTLAEVVVALAALGAGAPDPQVRETAQNAVRALAVPATAAGLVSRLADPGLTREEREPAIVAAASLGVPALTVLVDAYLSATDPDVKDACTEVVVRTGALAVPALARRVVEDQHETKKGAAALLGVTRSPDALPLLLPLAHDADWSVRCAGVSALGRLGGVDASRAVMAALHDPDDHVRAAAAEAAGDLGDRSAGSILLACLVEEPDEDVTRALVDALGALREEGAVPKLAELARFVSGVFQRRAVAVRVAAVHALAAIATPDARAVLERHRDDSVPEVRAAVVQALA